jgi:hypothetical protein
LILSEAELMTLLQLFTIFHTVLSLVAIIAGLLVVKGMIASHGRQLWTLLFLVTAAATTITGFFLPFQGLTPAWILGVISIPPIVLAFLARYRYRRAGAWRGIYVVTSVITLYFNCFVLVVQAFRHVPALHALAPAQTEPPFQVAQLATLVLFAVIGFYAYRNYRLKTEELLTGYVSPHLEPK